MEQISQNTPPCIKYTLVTRSISRGSYLDLPWCLLTNVYMLQWATASTEFDLCFFEENWLISIAWLQVPEAPLRAKNSSTPYTGNRQLTWQFLAWISLYTSCLYTCTHSKQATSTWDRRFKSNHQVLQYKNCCFSKENQQKWVIWVQIIHICFATIIMAWFIEISWTNK